MLIAVELDIDLAFALYLECRRGRVYQRSALWEG